MSGVSNTSAKYSLNLAAGIEGCVIQVTGKIVPILYICILLV